MARSRKTEGYRARRLAARRNRRWGAYQNLALYALAAVVAFGAVLGAVHLAHDLRHHHVLPGSASYLALVTLRRRRRGHAAHRGPARAQRDLATTTLYTIPPDLLLTNAAGEYVMAGDVAAEGQLKPYLERLVHAPISYRLDLSYADLSRLSGGSDLLVTAAAPFSLQTGGAIRLFNGRFSLPASQLATVLTAAGKGQTDQATAQDDFLTAALAGAAAVPAARQAAQIKALAAHQQGLAVVDARDLLETLVSGRVTVTRLPSAGQVSDGQFAWRPDPTAITAQITRNARYFHAPLHGRRRERLRRPGHGRARREPACRSQRQPAGGAQRRVVQLRRHADPGRRARPSAVANQVRGILGRGVVLTGSGLPDTTVVVIVGKDLKAKDLQ